MSIDKQHTRWGEGTRTSGSKGRDRILAAAQTCYSNIGVHKTTVEDVAHEAKVSRTTVYRYFNNRDELLTAVVFGETKYVIDIIAKRLETVSDLADFMVEAMVIALEETPKMPMADAIFSEDGTTLASRLCFSSEEIIALGTGLIAKRFELAQAQQKISAELNIILVIEWVVRILLSYLSSPSLVTQSSEQQRQLFNLFIRPTLQPS